MKIVIEISEYDYGKVRNTEMTVDEMENTTQGRVYSAIVCGEVQDEDSD